MKLYDLKQQNEYQIKLPDRADLDDNTKIPFVSDIMFKTMINNSNNVYLISHIIGLIIDEDIEDIKSNLVLEKDSLDQDKSEDKRRAVDFIARYKDYIIGIEMNNYFNNITPIRNLKYAFDMYQAKLKRGDDYNPKEMVVQVNFINYSFGEGITDEAFDVKSRKREVVFVDNFIIINFYLPEIRRKYYNQGINSLSRLERLLMILIETKIAEARKISNGDNIMEEFLDKNIEASKSDDILGVYDKEKLDKLMRRADIEEAKNETKKEMVLSLIENGVDINIISKSTGLTKDEIKQMIS